MKCPDFSEILEYFERPSTSAAHKRVGDHIESGCTICGRTMEWLNRTMKAMKAGPVLFDAPETFVRKAIHAFPKKHTVRDWLTAKLQFDSWKDPQTAGIRSSGEGLRQCIYVSDSYKILLMMEPAGSGTQVIGQLVALHPDTDVAGCAIELSAKKKRLSLVYTNPNGQFLLSSVPAVFELKIHGAPDSVHLRHDPS